MAGTTSKPLMQPPHREVREVQQQLRAALEAADARQGAQRTVEAFSAARTDDEEGLAGLLADLGISRPEDLVAVVQLVTTSAAHTAVSWARGLAATDGAAYDRATVLRAAWAGLEWGEPDV